MIDPKQIGEWKAAVKRSEDDCSPASSGHETLLRDTDIAALLAEVERLTAVMDEISRSGPLGGAFCAGKAADALGLPANDPRRHL